MGALDGRVAIITGAGRGLGREHAFLFASEGAKVVVNDLGGDMHGEGGDPSSAMQTVDEIKAMGGEAVVNGDNVADWAGSQRMVQQAIDAFGDLHVLVLRTHQPGRLEHRKVLGDRRQGHRPHRPGRQFKMRAAVYSRLKSAFDADSIRSCGQTQTNSADVPS